jgi:hypothetical protein
MMPARFSRRAPNPKAALAPMLWPPTTTRVTPNFVRRSTA